MKKAILAVSGGVDSVLMLEVLFEKWLAEFGEEEARSKIIVAHFEHGIRGEESLADLNFVQKLAQEKGLRFEFSRGFLGENASEETARRARYEFLRNLAQSENAVIFTAHHKNDLAETFALNLARGGGWRAAACLDSPDICRPFLALSKEEILQKALSKNLVWREDSTNSDEKFARNKIRKNLKFSKKTLDEIYEIWARQIKIKREIENLVTEILPQISKNDKFERAFFRENSDEVCAEILREILRVQSGEIPLSKQIWDFLAKIRNYKNGSKTQILGGKSVKFSREFFEFENSLEKC